MTAEVSTVPVKQVGPEISAGGFADRPVKSDKIADGRNYGIDLLKITAMFMVVLLHTLGQGGVLSACEPGTANYHAAWLIEIVAYCAVNCFALATGFVMVKTRFKFTRILSLWVPVVFYALFITLGFSAVYPGSISVIDWVHAALPVSYAQYWYFTAYFCLFFFIPFLNHLLNTLPPARLKLLVILVTVMFSVIPTLAHRDLFITHGGYSALWLICLYLIGGCLRVCDIRIKRNAVWLLLYFVCIAVTFAAKLAVPEIPLVRRIYSENMLVSYISPTVLLAAVSLLQFFRNIRPEKALKRIIAFIAPLAFYVYIIHTHPLIFRGILKDRFAGFADFNTAGLIAAVFAAAACIFLCCLVIELIRSRIFRLLRFNSLVSALESRISGLASRKPAS